jgi:diaminopropionate ammonia-lyase
MMESINWILNRRAWSCKESSAAKRVIADGVSTTTRRFHSQIPGYKISPLKSLHKLASMLGLGGIWVKDESQRLELNSFKVLGGSYAIYNVLRQKLGLIDSELTLNDLRKPGYRDKLGTLTFAAATDGNHGRGVAWAAEKLGHKCVIYVPRGTAQSRISAIEGYGAQVKVIDGNYDEAVERIWKDAKMNGWQVISDTAWQGYEEIPIWVMQGYATLFSESQEQLAAQGIIRPSHIFLQAGVGALAASGVAYYRSLFGDKAPLVTIVEPTSTACLFESVRIGEGKPYQIEGDLHTIMAGLSCGRPNPIAWDVLWDCAHVFISCPDFVAARGMRVYAVPLSEDPFIVSGESGAVTLGVLTFIMQRSELAPLRERLGLDRESQVLLINSEGNTAPDEFRKVVWEGALGVPPTFSVSQVGGY